MADIMYSWLVKQAFQVSKDVSLPQFKVLGYRQLTREAFQTTGKYAFRYACLIDTNIEINSRV